MQAFSNIRVVDLTHVLAGPFCTYQLAVMGADVIKVEPTHNPDMMRATDYEFPHGEKGLGDFFIAQNANKRAIAVDIKTEQGKEILTRLIATADVLVENYRSGALADLGFGYDAVKKIKADIIYCSLTGFGQDGPKAKQTAYDNVIQAFSGLMSANGDPDNTPIKVGPPVLDYGTGIQAAFAIAAALFQRSQSGDGQHIDIAMLDSAIMLMSSNVTYYQRNGKLIPNTGNKSPHNAGYCSYPTREGMLMLGAYTGEQARNLWHVLGDPEHGDALSGLNPPVMAEHFERDTPRIAEILLQKTADEWEELLHQQKVPAARVRKLDETLAHEQLESRTVLQKVEGIEDSPLLPTASFKYEQNGPKLTRLPPVFGQHTREVLSELGYSEQQVNELADNQAITTH